MSESGIGAISRRTLLKTGAAAGSGGLSAGAAAAAGLSQLRLGIDTYSIRAFNWNAFQLLDYAAAQKVDTLQFSGLNVFESLDAAYLAKVQEHARRLGISMEGGIGSICPTSGSWNPKDVEPVQYLLKGMRVTQAIGASVMRCFIGSAAERRGPLPVEAHIESTLKVLRAARSAARDTGVKVAIENHNGDVEARELRALIQEAGPDWVGCTYDSGNPMWLLEDPLFTLEILAPHLLTSHIRDSVVYEHPRGAAFQWVALGDGCVHMDRVLARYAELCPQAPMQLEVITGRPPQVLPYLEESFWKAFPRKPAADFARFVALVKQGRPYEGPMMVAAAGPQPREYQQALNEQQRRDLERSIQFARDTWRVGVKGA